MQQTKKRRLTRSEVPVEQTWNLQDLFTTEEDWEQALLKIEEELPKVEQYNGRLHEGSDTLLSCLNEFEALYKTFIHIATYANLRLSEDGTNPVNQANGARVGAVSARIQAALSFIEPEILQLPEGVVEKYIQENNGLQSFENYLNDIISKKPYTLSLETEKALASLSELHESPYMIYQRSKSSDMQFDSITDDEGNELPMSFALYEDEYEFSSSTNVRRRAYDSFIKTLKQYENTYAATYSTEITKQVRMAKLRGYQSVTEMLLHPQKVTEQMYNNQLDVIQEELAPHMRRFAKLKKVILGLDKMTFADLKAPLDPNFNPSTTYEEACETILKSLQVMGPEYSAIMEKALTERWVDLADNVGKSTGAFCSSPYGAHPYILITWTNTMRGGFVLAHELGHAGHFYLAGGAQRFVNTRPSLYFVEAPSTMNEMLLGQYIMKNSNDPQMKRWVILQLLGTYYHNFVTHLLEAEMQRRVYTLAEQGKAITASVLNEQKRDLLQKFWGDTVEIDEGAALTWMRQPHYYMGLYPYTYSAGLTASTAAAQMIQEEGQPAVDRWLSVLRAGGTMSPLELMKTAGVDMSTPAPIRKAVAYVGGLIDELEQSFE